PRLMHHFLDSNPGLRSRFSREIVFPDYSTEELLAIARTFAVENEYVFGEGSEDALRRVLEGSARGERFGNARFVRTLFEQALNQQALRLAGVRGVELEGLERSELTTLDAEDVLAAARGLGEEPGADARGSFWRRRR